MPLPRHVAICGAPGAGKSAVANILNDAFGAVIIDDGMILRRACAALYSLPLSDFVTQEGKARTTIVCGQDYLNRELLGDLGTVLESFYGDQFMPEQALRQADAIKGDVPFFVFPSVRKNQGESYLGRGGMVLEVVRPGHRPVKAFDQYEERYITHVVVNNGDLRQLERRVVAMFLMMGYGA